MSQDTPVVDVVVPVYGGLAETRVCLDSVLATPSTVPFELVVIDDASPEPALRALLDALAADGRIRLERHSENRGFVVAANRGLALNPARDVVLLNSDTVVAGDWLARLRACALAHGDIASVSPFSNNATILSYPLPGRVNPLPAGMDTAALDAVFAQANAGKAIDIPVSVGFCMYLRRAALDAIGLFDEQRFGKGYGEECDWCLRASDQGWRHRLCADTFVYHAGGVSFSAEAAERSRAAQATLSEMHPQYTALVMAYEHLDPARPLRRAVDTHRAASGEHAAAAVLAERDHEIDRLHADLTRTRAQYDRLRGEFDDTVQALQQRDLALGQAQGFVREREADVRRTEAQLTAVIAEHQRTCDALAQRDARLQAAEAELQAIKSSRLWRVANLLRSPFR